MHVKIFGIKPNEEPVILCEMISSEKNYTDISVNNIYQYLIILQDKQFENEIFKEYERVYMEIN